MRTSLEDTARAAVRDYLDSLESQMRDLKSNGHQSTEIGRRIARKIQAVNKARSELLNAEVL